MLLIYIYIFFTFLDQLKIYFGYYFIKILFNSFVIKWDYMNLFKYCMFCFLHVIVIIIILFIYLYQISIFVTSYLLNLIQFITWVINFNYFWKACQWCPINFLYIKKYFDLVNIKSGSKHQFSDLMKKPKHNKTLNKYTKLIFLKIKFVILFLIFKKVLNIKFY